ncbi:entericidin A/B family lipoprotein [Neisseria arctica]
MMKKTFWLALGAAVLLSACNTVAGFGADVQKAGSKLEQSAERHNAQ